MKTTISLQELAIKLNGKFWSKEGKERIYLDRGYNTKKMSTKTYVEIKNDEFVVRCFIDCPSQNHNWIESQQDDVISNVSQEIKEVLATEYFYIVNEKGSVIDDCGTEKQLAELYTGGGLYLYEVLAKITMQREGFDGEIKSISREDFEKLEVKVSEKIKEDKIEEVIPTPVVEKVKIELGNGKKVSHARFGLGEILEEIDGGEKLRILFETEGEKYLLARFANLTFL